MGVSLSEFMSGVPLQYKGFKHKRCTATVVSDTSVAVEDHKGRTSFARVEGRRQLAALYHNLTRSPQYASKGS